ncbi:Solute carrier family 41 member 2 [Dirofilaria immitis]|nr:Solute carrier family 41 member 2 [Dirofilaria immitis]
MAQIQRLQSVPSEPMFSTSSSQQVAEGEERENAVLIHVLRQTFEKIIANFPDIITIFVAGLGQICTGLFLKEHNIGGFFICARSIYSGTSFAWLKGNLEVTYASRFCTLSNAGQTNKAEEIFVIARFNLCLIELQAIVLSFLQLCLALQLFKQSHATIILSSSIYAASLSSLIIGFVMITIVVSSRRYGIDPDNIAAPITATLTDFITLIMLIGIGMLVVYMYIHNLYILNIVMLIFLLCTTPFLAYCAAKNPRTRVILKNGWFAVSAAIIVAWLIFSCSGLLLQSAIVVYPGIAALHPLIAGLAGNRVSVQSSRLATALHLSEYSLGILPTGTTIWTFLNPLRLLCLRHLDSKVAFLLLVTAIPYNFSFVIVVISIAQNINFSWILVGGYVMATIVQGLLLFYLCQVTVYALWWFRLDPDNSSVPVLTSVGDLLGIGLLYIVFSFLHHFAPSTVLYQRYQTMNVTRQCDEICRSKDDDDDDDDDDDEMMMMMMMMIFTQGHDVSIYLSSTSIKSSLSKELNRTISSSSKN